MSKLSIYETNWINLVFENKNKEYGAYQLRQESTKTSFFALFMGLLLCASLMIIPKISGFFQGETTTPPETITPLDEVVTVTDIFPEKNEPIQQSSAAKPVQQKTSETIPKDQLVNPTVVAANDAVQDIAKNTENVAVTNPSPDGTAITGLNPTSGQGTGTGGSDALDTGETIVITTALDKQPEFPGGMSKFYNYVSKTFRTPDLNDERIVRIYVSFVVERDGSMTAIHVKNDPGYGLGAEAIRVLKSLKTKWTPGIINSKPVRTAYSLPITVQID
jgi:periplasmic protein TonB